MEKFTSPLPLYPNVDRRYFYSEPSANAFFAWQHIPITKQARQHTVIVCPPLGYEYTHSHRSIKHLAEFLANQGLVVFRFDYYGTGDSPGWDFDENRIDTWLANIATLVENVKQEYPSHLITLVGIRLGATLASLATRNNHIDHLVLWEPIVKGSAYARELMAIARLAQDTQDITEQWIESAGFLMSTQTIESIKAINLTTTPIDVKKSILCINRDDRSSELHLSGALSIGSTLIIEKNLPGFAEMMDEPHDTEVPFTTIKFISDWLISESETSFEHIDFLSTMQNNNTVVFPLPTTPDIILEESPSWYKADDYLFGLASQLKAGYDKSLPAIILLNSGAVHHVGPNRIYVSIARLLAAKGYYVFRLDLEGLGDSVSADPMQENHPFQKNAVHNTFAAIQHLQNKGIAGKFIVGGLCSGAHASFHCALAEQNKSLDEKLIQRILLINPLTFYWHDGMSLAVTVRGDTQTIKDKMQYTRSVRDPNKWKKLLRGKVSLIYIIKFLFSIISFKLKSYIIHFAEVLGFSKTQLSTDMSTLLNSGLIINFIFSSTDPGLDIVKKEAPQILSKGLASKKIGLAIIENSNHTFSKISMREKLFSQIHSIF